MAIYREENLDILSQSILSEKNNTAETNKTEEKELAQIFLDPDAEENGNEDKIGEIEFRQEATAEMEFSPQEGKYNSSPYMGVLTKSRARISIISVEAVWTKQVEISEGIRIGAQMQKPEENFTAPEEERNLTEIPPAENITESLNETINVNETIEIEKNITEEIEAQNITIPENMTIYEMDASGFGQDFSEAGNETKPKGWYLKTKLNLMNEDDMEMYPAMKIVDGKKALTVKGIVPGNSSFFSAPIRWKGGKVNIKVLFKPVEEKCNISAVFGIETMFDDGIGDRTLSFSAGKDGNVYGGREDCKDFEVSATSKGKGWYLLSAESVEPIEPKKILRLFAAQESLECDSFYIREFKIK